MEQVIFGGIYDDPLTGPTEYNLLVGGSSWSGTDHGRSQLVGTAGKIKNLRVKLEGSPGAGKSYTFTLMLNGAPSALTLEIADTATSGADTTHEVDIVASDTVSLQCVPTNTPTDIYATWTSMFEGSTAKESLILASSEYKLVATGVRYSQVSGHGYPQSADENEARQVCPTSGTIKNLYVKLKEDPGTPPDDAYRFTLRVNGASPVDGLVVTITADDTTGNDTEHEVTVVAGDVLTMMIEPLNVPSAAPYAKWGMTFVADTDGESVVLASTVQENLDPVNPMYIYFANNPYRGWGATESERYQLGQSCFLKKLQVLLSAAPGDDKSYTFTLRKPGNGHADGNLTVTITGAATTEGHDIVHTDAISDDDYVDLKCVPANMPDVGDAYWGVVSYIKPPPPPPETPVTDGKYIGIRIIRR